MNKRLATLVIISSLGALVSNGQETATGLNNPAGSMPPATNNLKGFFPSPTNHPSGQVITNNPFGSGFPSVSNTPQGFVPAGYTNPYASYTNPYYNYTNPYWAAHNTNSAGSVNTYGSTNGVEQAMNTNDLNGKNNYNSSTVKTNHSHWWKLW